MTLKGEWSAETTYAEGDVVRYSNGTFYQMVRLGKAGVPCADALYWNPLPSPLAECAKMIMDMGSAIKADFDSDFGMVAAEYSKTTYSKGDIVRHDGKLYKAKQNIGTAEDWTASHWDETTVSGELVTLNAAAATIPTNIDSDSIALIGSDDKEYVITVDASGDTPEVIATLDE